MPIRPENFSGCSWSWTVVCGADDTSRERFAYEFALRHGGRVVDTGDLLTAARALTEPSAQPGLFLADAEDARGFEPCEGPGRSRREPLPGTPAELAVARMRTADALGPAVSKVIGRGPVVRDAAGWSPHSIIAGRYALPTQGFDFSVVVTATEEQILENLRAEDPHDEALELRAQTAILIQEELVRRGNAHGAGHCRVLYAPAGAASGSVEAVYDAMSDFWDSSTALGGLW